MKKVSVFRLGVLALTLALVMLLVPLPAMADPGENEWAKLSIPEAGGKGDWVLTGDFAAGASGVTAVAVAYDGPTGIAKAKDFKPDMILLDIVMPGMHGLEVSKRLLADPDTKEIPITLFTATLQTDLEAKCRDLGVSTCIMKPFQTDELLGLIEKTVQN